MQPEPHKSMAGTSNGGKSAAGAVVSAIVLVGVYFDFDRRVGLEGFGRVIAPAYDEDEVEE